MRFKEQIKEVHRREIIKELFCIRSRAQAALRNMYTNIWTRWFEIPFQWYYIRYIESALKSLSAVKRY